MRKGRSAVQDRSFMRIQRGASVVTLHRVRGGQAREVTDRRGARRF
jgi:hypothetical protein